MATFGKPDFIHRFWDHRAESMIAPDDVAVFANAVEMKPPYEQNFDDSAVF